MSAQPKLEMWTEQEYWDTEEKSSVKHEFINGQLYAMAGGTEAHADICLNIASAAKNRLRGKPCKAANSELKVKVEATGDSFYPDAMIHCPPARFEGKGNHTLLTPSVLFEVLSNSTKKFNSEGKMLFYQKIETLTDYVLVDAERICVEHFSRDNASEDWRWRLHTRSSEVVRFPKLQLELPMEEIYEELELIEDWVETKWRKQTKSNLRIERESKQRISENVHYRLQCVEAQETVRSVLAVAAASTPL